MRDKHTAIGIILFVLILGSCFIIPNGTDLRLQRQVNFQFILLASAGLYIGLNMTVAIGVLVLYTLFEAVRAVNLETLITLAGLATFYVFMVKSQSQWRHKKSLLYDALIVIAGLNLAFQVMQYFGVHLLSHPNPGQEKALPGLMSNVDETFALYMVCLPAFFRKYRWQLLIPIGVVGLLLASPMVSSNIPYLVGQHVGGRVDVWRATLLDLAQHQWIGHGFSQYAFLNTSTNELFTEAHNEFVEILWRYGILGGLVFMWSLFKLIRQGYSCSDKIPVYGLIAACVAAMGFFIWHIFPLALLTVFWVSLIQVEIGIRNTSLNVEYSTQRSVLRSLKTKRR